MRHLLLLLAFEGHGAGIQSFVERSLVCLKHSYRNLGVLVASHGSLFLLFGELALDGLEVFELQFGVYYLLVFKRVYRSSSLTYDVVVVEAAQYVYYGVGLAYVAKELVAQSFALARSLHQSGYVHNLACCGYYASRVYYLGEACEPFVGHCYHAHVGFYGAERKVGCLCLGVRQTVEKSRFAHIRQSYDTTF